MIGMLIGIAALSAWGLYKFNQYLPQKLAAIPTPDLTTPGGKVAQLARLKEATVEAYVSQYGDIFTATWIVCIVGAVLGLLISGRNEHADEPGDDAEFGDVTDTPTGLIEAPTQEISRQNAEETVRLQQPPGRHRSR